MCEVRSRKKQPRTNPQKKNTIISSEKKMDYDEPHLMLNEKLELIQWTERPTGASMAAGSLWPLVITYVV
jgi:hypothetical protein